MVKVLRNQLFAIPERNGQWLRNVQSLGLCFRTYAPAK